MFEKKNNIIRSIFDPTIPLDELSFNDTDEGTNQKYKERGIKLQKRVGNQFPLVRINDYIISEDELLKLVIDTTKFLPTIFLIIEIGKVSTFLSRAFPKDGDRINVFIRSRDDIFKPIRNDYLITSVSTTKSLNEQGEGMRITIQGELFIPKIMDEIIISKTGTSLEVLQELASDLQLGFATNETQTNDKQTWICANDNYINFIKHIADSSWKDENSFFQVFIDIYYNLNFINVNNQFSNSTEIDEALIDLLISDDSIVDNEIKMSIGKKVFTNINDRRGTNMFIKRYKIVNNSSRIAKKFGYKMHCEFFEHNSLKKWDIYSEPLIVEGAEKDNILLKGKPGENYYKTQIKKRWMGIQYSLPEHNVHEKYLYSRIHNLMNLKELEKMQVHIEVPRANFNVYRGERIPCIFVATGEPLKNEYLKQQAEREESDLASPSSPVLDKFYTGFYMIYGMIFTYTTRNPQDSNDRGYFSEDIILTRRVWPLPRE